MPASSEDNIENLRSRVRFRVAHAVGFACADVDDIVQETLTRFLLAQREGKVNESAAGAFLNAICRNVIFEYRRKIHRDEAMPEILSDPPDKRISGAEQFEMNDAISRAMAELPARDREILHSFFIDEKPKEEIYAAFGLTYEQFRVVLCRAKERFRSVYRAQLQQRRAAVQSQITVRA
jgi:RNA polymerase sigma factor (sigma-70 family)